MIAEDNPNNSRPLMASSGRSNRHRSERTKVEISPTITKATVGDLNQMRRHRDERDRHHHGDVARARLQATRNASSACAEKPVPEFYESRPLLGLFYCFVAGSAPVDIELTAAAPPAKTVAQVESKPVLLKGMEFVPVGADAVWTLPHSKGTRTFNSACASPTAANRCRVQSKGPDADGVAT